MSDDLAVAKEYLSISAVNIRESFSRLNENFEPFELGKIESEMQTYRGVSNVKKLIFKGNEKEQVEYAFFYAVGIRLVEKSGLGSETGQDANVLVEIIATFSAHYRSEIELDKAVLEAFSKQNVGYHVWPYWREFVQSASARMNVPAPEIPFYFCSCSASD